MQAVTEDEFSFGTELEAVLVLGGDGTILRAAELARGTGAPLIGVNFGHVGFLAETEREQVDEVVRRIADARLHGRGSRHDRDHRAPTRCATGERTGR